jgi:DNA polymerase-3 subunit delta
MRMTLDQLPAALCRGLKSSYLVSGDEPLLVSEACDAIRASARADSYLDRQVFFVEKGFDWDALRNAAQSLSLFAERRLFELRMPTGKADRGADYLADIIDNPPPDTILLIVTGKLDRKTGDAPWARALQRRGACVEISPVGPEALPGWLRDRAKRSNLRLDPDAAQLIAARAEGNLLAAAQEIDKLAMLATDGRIDMQTVRDSVGQSARYDVFDLATAASRGQAARALQVLEGLKSEGIEPPLILWALSRELRGLWQARERERLRSNERGSAWNQASPPSPEAMARARQLPLAQLLREASNVDRIVKGQLRGDAWTALRALTAAFAGALHQSMLSGRVA